MKQWKTDVIEVYNETSFKECVMYCTEQKVISRDYEKDILLQYNSSEDLESDVVCNFFDYIGISEDDFLEIQEILN